MELTGKNAIITGAAKRLGRAIALALAEKGMNIAIHYHHSKKEAWELAETIGGMGREVIPVKADITKRKQIRLAMDEIAKKFDEFHLLVNNAAIFGPSPIYDTSDKEWDEFLDINLKAPFYFAQRFGENNSAEVAKIINIADSYGISPSAKFIPYGVSKGGVIHLTKGLAKALAPNILVNCICPGPISIPESSGDPPCPPKTEASTESDHHKRAVNATLLKREGHVEDIIKTVLFLAENDYITGQAIFVDGGRTV